MHNPPRFLSVLALASLALLPDGVRADEYFERPQFEQLLPQRSALALLVDREDRLWIATREGIARWDGSRIRHWRQQPFKLDSLGGNVMRGLLEDRRGDIWAFNPTGFYRHTEPTRLLGPTHERVQRYPFPGAFLVTDPAGEVLLIDTGSLYRYDAGQDAFAHVLQWSDPGPAVSAALSEPDQVWIATVDGRLRRCDIAQALCTSIDSAPIDSSATEGRARITSLWRDRDGRLNVGLAAAGVALLDQAADSLRPHPDWPDSWSTVTIRENFRHNDQTVLLTTAGLIWPQQQSQANCPNRIGNWCRRPVPRGDGPDDATISSAAVDARGVLWVGSNWGLSLHDPRAGAFRHWVSGPQGELDDGWVLALAEDASGAIWAGTFNGQLYRIEPGDGRVELRLRLPDDGDAGRFRIIWAIVPMDDRLWLGSNNGLVEYQPDTGDYRILTPPGSRRGMIEGDGEVSGDPSFVHTLAAAGEDSLWLGTNGGGTWRFDRQSETFTRPAANLPDWINHVLPNEQSLWLASANDGVYRVGSEDPAVLHFGHDPDNPASLPSDTVWMLHRDRSGRIWAGTDAGLSQLDSRHGSIHPGLAGLELPSIAAMSIAEDRSGQLWIGTNSGLVRFDPDSGRVRRFDRGDGLANIEYNRRAALAARDGRLYFGGDRGIVAVHPERIPADPPAPRVRFDALVQRDQDGQRIEPLGPDQALVVAPGQAQFGLRLSSTELARPERLRYQVRLAGLETQWRELGSASEIFFNRVPPGDYRLEARVSDGGPASSALISARSLIVRPTVWQTNGFRAVAAGAIVVLLIALSAAWQRHRSQAQLQALEQRRALAEERNRISRDMHDEVGSGLTEIALLSDSTLGHNSLPADPDGSAVGHIRARSRELLDAIGSIIWALNPDNDRLDRLLAFVRESSARQCEFFGLATRFEFPEHVPAIPVSASFARHLTLMVREALTNAGKHAGARSIGLQVLLQSDRLRLEIDDDGCGFDPAVMVQGNGLKHLRTRAAELGGELEITSRPGRGTRVSICIGFGS